MSELQQRKRPWYTEDILYIIAERLLARIPDRYPPLIDFRERNCYTYFMSHNEMAMRTTISQFAKFKRIVFSKDGEEKIEFYKNDSFKLYGYGLQSEEFGGPYYVLPGMLEYIIENGKLRVNTIQTKRFFPDDHSTDIKELGEMNSLKAFCALFLGKQVQIPDGLNNNLLVEKFCIDEKTMIIQNNFEAILAIDAVELKLDIADMHTNFIDCSQYKRNFQFKAMICSNLALHPLLKMLINMLVTLHAHWNVLMLVAESINCNSTLLCSEIDSDNEEENGYGENDCEEEPH